MSLRMVLRSTDSSEYFEKQPNCFRIQLNKQVQLDGYWTIGLTEFATERWNSNKKSQEVFICCDMCEETFVGGKDMPLLRRVYLGEKQETNIIYELPYYVPVKIGQLQQICIYITDREGNLVSFLDGPVSVTLHFKKFPYVL